MLCGTPPLVIMAPALLPFLPSQDITLYLGHFNYPSVVPRAWPSGSVLLPQFRLPQCLYLTPPHLGLSPRYHLQGPLPTDRGGCGGLHDIPLSVTCMSPVPVSRLLSLRHSNGGITNVQFSSPFLVHGSVSLDYCKQAHSYHHSQGRQQFYPKSLWAVLPLPMSP